MSLFSFLFLPPQQYYALLPFNTPLSLSLQLLITHTFTEEHGAEKLQNYGDVLKRLSKRSVRAQRLGV